MKKNFLLILIFTLFLGSITPYVVFAQEEESGVILLEKTLPNVGNEEGKVTDLGTYLNGMFLVGIGVATALAVVMITIGGVQYMVSESFGGKDAGREKISGAVWGLVLALGSFLILNTINPDLLSFNITDAVNSIRGEIQENRPPIVDTGETWEYYDDGVQVRALLNERTLDPVTNSPRVIITSTTGNSEECKKVGERGCTAMGGIAPRVYAAGSGLPALADRVAAYSGCKKITVTAGTEYWAHSATTKHRPGEAVVDIDNGCVDFYILSDYPGAQTSADLGAGCKPDAIVKDGVSFHWEGIGCKGSSGTHWHVEF